jgi:RHS repeat-associated protein
MRNDRTPSSTPRCNPFALNRCFRISRPGGQSQAKGIHAAGISRRADQLQRKRPAGRGHVRREWQYISRCVVLWQKLYSGEQFDPDLNLYFNRARYLNVSTGRFWTMDSYDGDPQSPGSLHKYLYAADDSVDRRDPSGHDSLDELMAGFTVASTVASLRNVLVAGVYSLYNGLPDAVGFGVYAAGGAGESHTLGGIGGAEVVYLPIESRII